MKLFYAKIISLKIYIDSYNSNFLNIYKRYKTHKLYKRLFESISNKINKEFLTYEELSDFCYFATTVNIEYDHKILSVSTIKTDESNLIRYYKISLHDPISGILKYEISLNIGNDIILDEIEINHNDFGMLHTTTHYDNVIKSKISNDFIISELIIDYIFGYIKGDKN